MKEDPLKQLMLPQIEELIKKFSILERSDHLSDWSGISTPDASEFITGGLGAIHRVLGDTDALTRRIEADVQKCSPHHLYAAVPHVGGALKALRDTINSGYLTSTKELIHASLFSDFPEMAEHLLAEGYKDPSAVLIGSVLEEHLRKLCDRNGIDTNFVGNNGEMRPKKVDGLNSDLTKANIYSTLDQKSVTAWLDLRNKAAHGHYDKFSKEQVDLLLHSVRDFLIRHPA